ncbi:MAG: glycine cleavage system protein H [Atopococcus tabaci]|uniref:Glycine cleavage system protein H n=1 Tax=Atopococcus tabaci TaxID=269774 RepID=A0AA43ZSU6_9LACT|nr:glycine cleavage system protein H [Atopococcus tabaci]
MKYSKEGLYIEKKGEEYRIGLSEKGQDDVGDVIFADIKAQKTIKKGDFLIGLEGGKAVSDLHSPLTGRVVKVNEQLSNFPERLNSDVKSRNWMIILTDVDEAEYAELEDESGFDSFDQE